MKPTVTVLIAIAGLSSPTFAADAKAGQAVYDKACKSCHGADGTPNPAIAKMLKVDMRALSSAEVQAQTDEELKKASTEGKGKMKPVSSVSGKSADDVVAFIRTLKK
jgi:cytochrome c5